ncbi:MAG: PhoH family protein, partial [Bacteroidales bacterium]|nr:PhoH family protein [Bacteroidales bacterium]
MTEKIYSIESYNALDIYGVNDRNVQMIQNGFPLLKFVIRGEFIKVIGEESEIEQFDRKFATMLLHYDKFGKLTEGDVEQIIGQSEEPEFYQTGETASDILLHGRQGNLIRARTTNQQKLVESTEKNDLVFAIGPAGTGKTYTAVALAVRALKNREVKRIILTRPAVEAGENLGFLPGDLKDKLDPYLQPLYDALRDMIPTQKLLSYMEDGTIEIAPIAFMRGRTLDNVFAILDEAQNATIPQMKMFLTRMGKAAKFIVTGDITQIDLRRNQVSGLVHA